jgi:hypothetical protein
MDLRLPTASGSMKSQGRTFNLRVGRRVQRMEPTRTENPMSRASLVRVHCLAIASVSVFASTAAGCGAPADRDPIGTSSAALSCGSTTPGGLISTWNDGVDNVDVYATDLNGGCPGSSGCGNVCARSNTDATFCTVDSAGVVTDGGWGFQCTELASRYFHFRWGQTLGSYEYAYDLCTNAPSEVTRPSTPVVGDLMVFDNAFNGGNGGHVAVVTGLNSNGTVNVIEENGSCTGHAIYSPSQRGSSGCYLHAPANSATPPSGGAPDCSNRSGWNCGDDGVINGAANTNYDCKLGQSTPLATEVCTYGCKIMPNGVADVCNSAPAAPDCANRSGWNCGDDGVINGAANTIYDCKLGQSTPLAANVCLYGCKIMPNGVADVCNSGPPAPDCSHRSGWNCGNDGVINGVANTLYDCKLGQSTPLAANVCPDGCVVMPEGTPDHCQVE